MHFSSVVQHAFLSLSLLHSATAIANPLFDHQLEELIQPDEEAFAMQLRRRHQQQDNESFAVTGVQHAGVQPRLEIRELAKRPDMFNVFLLGLARFQATPQDEKLSYYDTCSIHGRPYGTWDNVEPAPGIDSPGYCTHVSNLLLCWHRPYIAMFEQLLFEHIIDAVNTFPAGEVRQRYAKAALRVRWPFWDFAAAQADGSSVWPDVITTETIEVTLPNGTAEIKNPLYSYQFNPVITDDMLIYPFASWNETKRAPSGSDEYASSRNDVIAEELDNQRVGVMNRLYNLFVYYDNFTQFSNEAWVGDTQNADSIEAIHDTLHGIIGNTGHMTYLDFSAYDPIFFMLHCMIDRIFAIYQVLHPYTYIEPMAALTQSYTIPIGSMQDGNSPLQPFSRDTNGTKWTCNTVGSTKQFGYTYPETATENATDVRRAVNRLYGANAAAGCPLRKRDPLKAATPDEMYSTSGQVVDGRLRNYVANIVANKHALGRTYSIYLFVGDFDDTDPCTWATSPNLAGTQAPFTSLSIDSADVPKPTVKMAGTVPLTDILITKVKSGELASMDEDDVADYLKLNLHWRVATFEGQVVPVESMPELSVIVNTALIQPARSEDEFPSRSDFKELTHITQGRPGGC